MLFIDAHEDLAWSMLTFNRDYGNSVVETRQIEKTSNVPLINGNSMLGLPEWLDGKVAVIFSTIFLSPASHKNAAWDIMSYEKNEEAFSKAMRQMDVYSHFIEQHDNVDFIRTRGDLETIMLSWSSEKPHIGFVPLMEGADPIPRPEMAEQWFEHGLRIIGPAWAETIYTGSAYDSKPLKKNGEKLLEIMDDLGFILDLSHLSEKAFYRCLDIYEGTIIVSHANTRRFLQSERGLSDEMVAAAAERGAVIGIVPFNAFLKPGWQIGDPKNAVTLDTVGDAIDHICQITGNAEHVAFGTDFDGGFGVESTPEGLDTIADMQKLTNLLQKRGYTEIDIARIFHGNWLATLREGLPE